MADRVLERPPPTLSVAERPRTRAVLALATLAGLAMFCWPLLVDAPEATVGHTSDAPLAFVLLLPIVLAVVLAEMADEGIDARALAMLGVLSAVDAALRPLGAGVGGIELVFFLLVLGGRVFGPGFGFALGCLSLLASAFLTAGVGPWLPFQMMASAWVGLGAGLLPRRVGGRAEIAMLSVYGAVAALAYGALMNLWFWPFSIGNDTALSFVAGDPVLDNLQRFGAFTLVSSTLGFDLGRAITTVLGIVLLGRPILVVLRRTARRARFDPR